MSNDSVISKINRCIQRLLIEYKKQNITLFKVLKQLESDDIKIKTHDEIEECYDGVGNIYLEKSYVHALIFTLPKKCFENDISISNQEAISNKIKQDLNQIMPESDEYIKEVKFDLKNEVNTYLKGKIMNTEVPDFWDKDCLRIFISHSAQNYSLAKKLKKHLTDSGISCFLAHKDIVPTKKWRGEIIKALKSMEMMLCLVTKDSCKSWWVNQEIGFALGRKEREEDLPIIPIKLDEHDPKGFISEIQAQSLDINNIESSAKYVIKLIIKRFSQYPPVKKHFLNQFLKAKDGSFLRAKEKFMDIINLEFNDQEIEKIVTTIESQVKGINQLIILLRDPIILEHLKQLQNNQYKYYAELLDDKVLSQHTQKRYSISKSNDRPTTFDIINNQQKIVRNQKISDKQKFEE